MSRRLEAPGERQHLPDPYPLKGNIEARPYLVFFGFLADEVNVGVRFQ